MFHGKKICNDLLHLALVFAFLRLGPQRIDPPYDPIDISDILIGPAVAYQRFNRHDLYSSSDRYVNLKSIDSDFIDDLTNVHDRLTFFSRNGFTRHVVAYYSDVDGAKVGDGASDVSSTGTGSGSNSSSAAVGDFADASPALPVDSVFNVEDIELTPEDMDLIEILWKQDIDLGVTREAFNPFENQNTEKVKAETEIAENAKELCVPGANSETYNECEEDISTHSELDGLSYIIDSETGEHIIQEPKTAEDDSIPESLLAVNGLEDGLEDLSTDCFLSAEECQDLSLASELIGSENLALQVEKYDEFIRFCEQALAEVESQPVGNEMYPGMEDYWQDISNTLSFSGTGTPSYHTCLPRLSRTLPEDCNDQAIASTSSEIQREPASNTFAETLYQNASLAQRSQDMISNFTYFNSSTIGSTSLGCAVASSIATLTNDTDSVPDICNSINSTYGLDLIGILQTNNTAAVCSNESLISEILLEDELQLMSVEAADGLVNCSSVPRMAIEQMDSSSDSISSSTNLSPESECNGDSRLKFEELTGAGHGNKESHHVSSKQYFNQPAASMPYSCADGPFQNSNADLNVPCRTNFSHYFHHNHTYHLPFYNDTNSPKPVTRDKVDDSKSDEENSRDEKRAKALKLPITINEIINLAIDEFNERLSKFELTEPQLTLIRDIRRRGKNKVAAQNCRKRKMDQISSLQQDLDLLRAERRQLESEHAELLHQRQNIREKYSLLYQAVFQSSTRPPLTIDVIPSSQQTRDSQESSNSTILEPSESENGLVFQGVRAKRKCAH